MTEIRPHERDKAAEQTIAGIARDIGTELVKRFEATGTDIGNPRQVGNHRHCRSYKEGPRRRVPARR